MSTEQTVRDGAPDLLICQPATAASATREARPNDGSGRADLPACGVRLCTQNVGAEDRWFEGFDSVYQASRPCRLATFIMS